VSSRTLRETLAFIVAIAATVIGVSYMLGGEQQVVIPAGKTMTPEVYSTVLQGLVQYSIGMGLALVMAGIAFILFGYEEDLTTAPEKRVDR
jgi:hypothetical protein